MGNGWTPASKDDWMPLKIAVILVIVFLAFMVAMIFLCELSNAQVSYALGRCEDFVWPVETRIVRSDYATASMEISEGTWLMSLPLDTKPVFDIPGIIGIWGFDQNSQRYVPAGKIGGLGPGAGYWMRAEREARLEMSGRIFGGYSLRLRKGWHLVGGCSYPAKVSSDDGKICDIFAYVDAGYVRMKHNGCIHPGQGYWIRYEPTGTEGSVRIERSDACR